MSERYSGYIRKISLKKCVLKNVEVKRFKIRDLL